MYPRIPPPPTGRASLEWYQITAMRHYNPAMLTHGEFADIWDKFDTDEVECLTREDYQKILAELNCNIAAKGEGKRNVNWRAVNPKDERSDPGAASSRDVPSANLANMHPLLPGKGNEKGKGKSSRILHREAWNRRRRAFEAHADAASQRTMTTADDTAQDLDDAEEQPPSEHPSMPELYTDLVAVPEEDNEEEEEEEEEIDDADADQPPYRERSLQPY